MVRTWFLDQDESWKYWLGIYLISLQSDWNLEPLCPLLSTKTPFHQGMSVSCQCVIDKITIFFWRLIHSSFFLDNLVMALKCPCTTQSELDHHLKTTNWNWNRNFILCHWVTKFLSYWSYNLGHKCKLPLQRTTRHFEYRSRSTTCFLLLLQILLSLYSKVLKNLGTSCLSFCTHLQLLQTWLTKFSILSLGNYVS